MERITRGDLESALLHHVDALERYGVNYDGRLVLNHGSKTNGRAYRLNRIPTGETGHWQPPIGSDYLGITAREAYDNLTTRTRAIHDMAQLLGLPRHETTLDRTEESLRREVGS